MTFYCFPLSWGMHLQIVEAIAIVGGAAGTYLGYRTVISLSWTPADPPSLSGSGRWERDLDLFLVRLSLFCWPALLDSAYCAEQLMQVQVWFEFTLPQPGAWHFHVFAGMDE